MKTRPYEFRIGDHQGFVLYDQSQVYTTEELIVNPVFEELEKIARDYDFDLNGILVGYNNLLLRAGDQYVLVDAGIRSPFGNLLSGLEDLKIDPEEITSIIITHSDKDHIGGILDEGGEITFPKARYFILEGAWQYWPSEEKRVELMRLNKWTEDNIQFAWETYLKIRDLIHLAKPGEEIHPGIRLFLAPGHRYDHSIVKVLSKGEQLIHLSDALSHPLFMGNRDWYSTYDANTSQAIESKTRLLELCAKENALAFGAHFPFPGLGYVRKGEGRWLWQPVGSKDDD